MERFVWTDSRWKQIPVSVGAKPKAESYVEGAPIEVQVVLRNGLHTHLEYPVYRAAPGVVNGELAAIRIERVRRGGSSEDLELTPPRVVIPDDYDGSGRGGLFRAAMGKRVIDLAKWTVAGGWTPGRYEVVVRMEPLHVDKRMTLSVASSPFTFTIE